MATDTGDQGEAAGSPSEPTEPDPSRKWIPANIPLDYPQDAVTNSEPPPTEPDPSRTWIPANIPLEQGSELTGLRGTGNDDPSSALNEPGPTTPSPARNKSGRVPVVIVAAILAVGTIVGIVALKGGGDNNNTDVSKVFAPTGASPDDTSGDAVVPTPSSSRNNGSSSSVASSTPAPSGTDPFVGSYSGTFSGLNPTDQLCPLGGSLPAIVTITSEAGSNVIVFNMEAHSKDGFIRFADVRATVGSNGIFRGTASDGTAISAHFTLDSNGNADSIDQGTLKSPSCNAAFEAARSR